MSASPFTYWEVTRLRKLKLYKISENYIEFLRETDPVNVKYNKNQRRPYIGIVLKLNQILYFAPLASPKSKHIKMKNSLDFIKIENGRLGAINLNNMIPVPQEAIMEFDISKEEESYRNLLYGQLKFIDRHAVEICSKAEKLYVSVTQYHSYLEKRCARFKDLEEKSKLYIKNERTVAGIDILTGSAYNNSGQETSL